MSFRAIPHIASKCTHNKIIALMSRHATEPIAIRDDVFCARFADYYSGVLYKRDFYRPLEIDDMVLNI
jgi:hypothetical protein